MFLFNIANTSDELTTGALKLPTVGGGHAVISQATVGDFTGGLDIANDFTLGHVTWTTRDLDVARVGRVCNLAIYAAGTKNTSSTAVARMKLSLSITGFDINAQNGTGIVGPLLLTNSTGSSLVYLGFYNGQYFYFRSPSAPAVNMTFNDVLGAGAFVISGTVGVLTVLG